MPKVFIYNGPASGQLSVDDTEELFKRYEIVKSADVLTTDLSGSFDGLTPARENITLVIPGGRALDMSTPLQRNYTVINNLLKHGCNYVGICAGGYLATSQASFYETSYYFTGADYQTPEFVTSWNNHPHNLNICSDYSAIGSFYPDSISYLLQICYGNDRFSEVDLRSLKYKPSSIELTLQSGKKIPQLYVAGCGFEPYPAANVPAQQQHQVAARYPKSYTFKDKNKVKTFDSLPAIITRNADHEHQQGGSFISGTHIEACVENSKLLKFFSQPSPKNLPLQKIDIKKLYESQAQAREEIIPLLKSTLNRITP